MNADDVSLILQRECIRGDIELSSSTIQSSKLNIPKINKVNPDSNEFYGLQKSNSLHLYLEHAIEELSSNSTQAEKTNMERGPNSTATDLSSLVDDVVLNIAERIPSGLGSCQDLHVHYLI